MRDVLADYERMSAAGARVGRAVVTSVRGSAPRMAGATLLAGSGGQVFGSVSGGCVEGAAVREIGEAQAAGAPRHVSYGVSHETAWAVGLACGGTITVYVEPTVNPRVLAAARGEAGAVVATVVEGAAPGTAITFREDGSDDAGAPEAWLRQAVAEAADKESAAVGAHGKKACRGAFGWIAPFQPQVPCGRDTFCQFCWGCLGLH